MTTTNVATVTATATATKTAARRPSRRLAKIVSLLAIPAAIAVSGVVVSQASYSAYSATTVNPTSNWATGTVALNDDDTNTAAFTAANLKPGATGSRCIVVTSTGSLASAVRLYATTPTTTKNLAANITLAITQGTGGSFGSCTGYTPLATGASVYTGTVDGFGTTATSYSTGLGSWAPAVNPAGTANESRTFQITYTVKTDAPDTTQGGTAAVGFTWEAQNS
jgi:hypothetical protein